MRISKDDIKTTHDSGRENLVTNLNQFKYSSKVVRMISFGVKTNVNLRSLKHKTLPVNSNNAQTLADEQVKSEFKHNEHISNVEAKSMFSKTEINITHLHQQTYS